MRAPTKLTLALRVTGVLPDGYHALDALVVDVDAPADLLSVADAGAGVTLHVHGPRAGGVPTDASNLAVRAALALLPEGAGLHLDLEKHIPAGAGLGGGSADAAAVLRELPKARFAHLATHGFFADAKFRSVLEVDPKLFETRGRERVDARLPAWDTPARDERRREQQRERQRRQRDELKGRIPHSELDEHRVGHLPGDQDGV